MRTSSNSSQPATLRRLDEGARQSSMKAFVKPSSWICHSSRCRSNSLIPISYKGFNKISSRRMSRFDAEFVLSHISSISTVTGSYFLSLKLYTLTMICRPRCVLQGASRYATGKEHVWFSRRDLSHATRRRNFDSLIRGRAVVL